MPTTLEWLGLQYNSTADLHIAQAPVGVKSIAGIISFIEALTLFPPPSPIYFGTTVRATWTSESQDPPFFDLGVQCPNFPAPSINVSTVQGEVFIALPSGVINLGISLADADQLQFKTWFLYDSSALTPSTTPPPGPVSTVSLFSLIMKTEWGSFTVTLSTISTHEPEETSNLSSSTFAKPVASQTASSSTDPLLLHHVNVGAIVGASVGGVSLVVVVIISLLWMRRRRSTAPILEPLAYSPEGSSTPTNRSNTSHTSGRDNVHEDSRDNLLGRQAPTRLEEGTEERLRRMVEQMSARILALEAQQREASLGNRDQPLPPYSNLEAQNNPPHSIEEPADASSYDPECQRGLAI
ncbi:hypothetical protein DXG01_016615 [Tephrocybe rancida]|nr:hypothetical protein DXG01_016615 [Tephrocybe rancida]